MKFAEIYQQPSRAANLHDCVDLLNKLRERFPNKIMIQVDLSSPLSIQPQMILQVVEQQLAPDGETLVWHVWAQRIFYNEFYSISYSALFDLLIAAYRELDQQLSY